MSWNLRDSKPSTKPNSREESAPPAERHYDDSEALPTVLSGMDDWEDSEDHENLTLEQRREMQTLGWASNREWDIMSSWMRRGVQETEDAPVVETLWEYEPSQSQRIPNSSETKPPV